MEDYYNCKKCNEEWGFIPEDYDSPEGYPTICPLCDMSVWEMIHDIWEQEKWGGIGFMIKMIFIRIKK